MLAGLENNQFRAEQEYGRLQERTITDLFEHMENIIPGHVEEILEHMGTINNRNTAHEANEKKNEVIINTMKIKSCIRKRKEIIIVSFFFQDRTVFPWS